MNILRIALVIILVAGMNVPSATAQGNWQPGDFGSARLRLGLFEPAGEGDYWTDKGIDWTGGPEDLEDFSAGFDYHLPLSRTSGLLFGLGSYSGETRQAYRDWVDQDGYDIRHLTELDTFEFTVTWMLRLRSRGHGPTPYIGVGVGLLAWELNESGDFLDFSQNPDAPDIVHLWFSDTGTTYQVHAIAGIEVPISSMVGAFVEARYNDADDTLGGDFAGFGSIDLSGAAYYGGLVFNF